MVPHLHTDIPKLKTQLCLPIAIPFNCQAGNFCLVGFAMDLK